MDQSKIGKWIMARRKEQGLTQAQLAEKLHITDRAVSKWETGKSLPDSSTMLELCGIFRVHRGRAPQRNPESRGGGASGASPAAKGPGGAAGRKAALVVGRPVLRRAFRGGADLFSL